MRNTLVVAVLSAAVGFGAAWKLQGHQLTKQELSHANERMLSQHRAHEVKERQTDAVIKAQNDAAARMGVLRHELDVARSNVVGLRDEIDVSMRAASTSFDACTVAATATSELLAVCAERYTELAGKAEGHVSDLRTLIESWPK